jgi:hypothetical protein
MVGLADVAGTNGGASFVGAGRDRRSPACLKGATRLTMMLASAYLPSGLRLKLTYPVEEALSG